MKINKYILFSLWCCFYATESKAQVDNPLNNNYWYFGTTNAALVFEKTNLEEVDVSVVNNQATPFGRGGSAVIANETTGDLLFYTDGAVLYDASHQIVPGGNTLNGNNTLNNAAVASPIPGSQGEFLIFTNPGGGAGNEISFTRVNSQLPGNANLAGQPPLGEIVGTPNNPTGLTNPAGAMIVISGTGDNYWLISQDATSRQIRVTAIESDTPGTTQSVNIFTVEAPSFEIASFAYNPALSLLAIAPVNNNRNVILLDFDPSDGSLTFNRQIVNTGNSDGFESAIADVAWSPDGNKLYISRLGSAAGNSAMVYQYGLDTLDFINPIFENPIFRSFGLQLAPDKKLYHLYQLAANSPIILGRLDSPDSLFSSVDYDSLPVGNVTFNGIQFPSFAPTTINPFEVIDFDVINGDACANSQVYFAPNVQPTPQTISWDFGDGESSNAFSPIHTYEEQFAGAVTMTVSLNGIFRTVSKPVNIRANETEVDLGADTTICKGERYVLNPFQSGQAPAGTRYTWSTGDTSPTILANPDSTRTYWVFVEFPNGCTGFDEVEITVYGDESQVFNYWYFGQNAGINFTPTAAPVGDGAMIAPEGTSTASDRQGNLLFYTNGSTVWNKDHQVMVNGLAIGGDSTVTQAAMIVPVAGVTPAGELSATVFYIFTPEKVWGENTYRMKYSIVDIKRNSSQGEVIAKNLPLFTNSTERLAATGFGGANTWTIAHEYGNNTFRAYPVSGEGIGSATVSSTGSIHSFQREENAKGYMKLAPNGTLLGVAIPGNQNILEIVRFDSIGRMRDPVRININEPVPAKIYGVEFSPGARKVYVTTIGGSSKLIQYSLDSIASENPVADIEATKNVLHTGGDQLGAIQTGPDGQVYVAVQNRNALGLINSPDADGANFVLSGFALSGGTTSLLGLPNFVQVVSAQPSAPGIAFENTCFGQPTIFTGSGTSDIDAYDWVWGDRPGSSLPNNPDTVDVQNPEHTYRELGNFNVQLRVYNRCGFDTTFVRPIDIFEVPEPPTVESPQNICSDPFVELIATEEDTPGNTYNWSTGDTERIIIVDEPSIITISITNADGCTSEERTVEVFEQRPQVSLGPDITICQDSDIPPLDAAVAGVTFSWTINESPAGSNRTQRVATDEPGIFIYTVRVFDPILKCEISDSVEITILPKPLVTDIQSFGSSCGEPTGRITFEIRGEGEFTYTATGPVNSAARSFNGINPVSLDSLSAGIYTLTVTNTVSGCTFTENVNIEDIATFDLLPSAEGLCGIGLFVTGSVGESVTVEVRDANGDIVTGSDGVVYDGTVVQNSNLFTTEPFVIGVAQGGRYNIAMRELGDPSCVQTAEIELEELFVEVNAEPDCNTNGVIILRATASVESGITYTWLDNAGNNLQEINAPTLRVRESGIYTVVISDREGNCTAEESIEVIIIPIDQDEILLNAMEEICSLDADPDINSVLLEPGIFDSYEWTLRGSTDIIATTSSLLVTEGGIYIVKLNNGSTCTNQRVVVTDDCSPEVFAPNAFTPNGDGLNDVFKVVPNDYVTEFSIFIYSRWGELVYQSDDINFEWGGEYRNQPLQDGTYAYVMRYRSTFETGGQQREQYGGVAIIR